MFKHSKNCFHTVIPLPTHLSLQHFVDTTNFVKRTKHFLQYINSNICSYFFHFHPDDNWSNQSKRRQSFFPSSGW